MGAMSRRRRQVAEKMFSMAPVAQHIWDIRDTQYEAYLERRAREAMSRRGRIVSELTRKSVGECVIDGLRLFPTDEYGEDRPPMVYVRFTAWVVPNRTEKRKRMMRKVKAGFFAAVAAVGLSSCAFANQQWHNDCRVTGKDVIYSVADGNSSRTQRLSTTCGAFDVESSIAGGFNSWDNWEALEVGKVYDIRTGGFRIGFTSSFPTVLEVRAK